jgi:hypothetical protein
VPDLHRVHPRTPILAFTVLADDQYTVGHCVSARLPIYPKSGTSAGNRAEDRSG